MNFFPSSLPLSFFLEEDHHVFLKDAFEGGGDVFEEGGRRRRKSQKIRARKKKRKEKRKENALSFGESARARDDDDDDDEEEKMSSSGERGGDDPHVLQSLKGGHRNNGITSLAFAPNSRKYIFSSSTGDGSIMFWHVGGNASSSSKNRKRPVRFLGHEKDVLTLAHTQREGEGGRVASGGLDRSVRVWKATA